MKYVVAFGRFWYDFIVGDAWEIALGVILALAAVAALMRFAHDIESVLGPLFALAVMALLAASLWAESRRHRPHGPH